MFIHISKQGGNYERIASNNILKFPLKIIYSQIDGHELDIIASDGFPIVPQRVGGVVFYAGERYDFAVLAQSNRDIG